MDMDAGVLMSGLAISTVGLGIFLYGKKMQLIKNVGIGVALMAFPIFVHSVLWVWLIAGGCVATLYFLPRGA